MRVCTKINILIVLFSMISVVLAMSEVDATVVTEHPCPCNEIWSDCGPPQGGCFERACGDIPLEGTACKAPCRPSCYCGIGYIRESAGGPCIAENKCPIISDT